MQIAEPLLEREHVGKRLHRVRFVGKTVEDRDRREGAQRQQVVVIGDPSHERIDIPAQHLGGVGQRFASLQLEIARAEEDRLTAELRDTRFERNAGPRAGVLEEQAERLAGEIRMHLAPFLHPLEPNGGIEHFENLVGRQIDVLDHVPAAHPRADRERRRRSGKRSAERDGAIRRARMRQIVISGGNFMNGSSGGAGFERLLGIGHRYVSLRLTSAT